MGPPDARQLEGRREQVDRVDALVALASGVADGRRPAPLAASRGVSTQLS